MRSYVSEVLADSPRAYYRMGEASGQPQDSSGNAMHTTVTNGSPTYHQPGALLSDVGNGAIGFLASNSDYFEAPDNAILDYGDVFTLEAWVKRGGTGAVEHFIIGKGDDGVNRAGGLYLQDDRVMLAQTDVAPMIYSTTFITDTTRWHHVVATKNGATMRIYVDGIDVTDLATANNLTCQNTSRPLTIGAEYNGGGGHGSFMVGGLDEVAVYNTALSAERVLAHYAAGLQSQSYAAQVLADVPVVYFRCQEPSGFIKDSSGNSRHATASPGGNNATYRQKSALSALSDTAINFSTATNFTVPDEAALDLGDTFSIEAWVKLLSLSPLDDRYVVTKGAAAYSMWVGSTNLLGLNCPTVGVVCSSRWPFADTSRFHHCVVTKSGSTVHVYIDAVDVSDTVSNQTFANTATPLVIGSSRVNDAFVGAYLDEVAVYPFALPYARVLAHYLAATTDLYSETILSLSPALYYQMQETLGEVAQDSSGYLRTAIIWNAPTLAAASVMPNRPDLFSIDLSANSISSISSSYAGYAGGNFTACGWAYRNSTAGVDTLFGSDGATTALKLSAASGSNDAVWWSDVNVASVSWAGVIPLTTVFHWALTYTDSTKTSELFINGVSQGTKVSANNLTSPGNVTFGIWFGSENWTGRQSHNAFFTSVLTSAQIREIYLAGVRVPRAVHAASLSGVGW